MNQLKTKWGEQLNTGKIHSEYPRPTMVRAERRNLQNTMAGSWFRFLWSQNYLVCRKY